MSLLLHAGEPTPADSRHTQSPASRARLDRERSSRRVAELYRRALALRDGIQRADRPATRRAAGELGRAEDLRVFRHVREVDRLTGAERRNLRRPADAPRAEHGETRHVGAEEAAQAAEAEVSRALDKERPLLVKEGLER